MSQLETCIVAVLWLHGSSNLFTKTNSWLKNCKWQEIIVSFELLPAILQGICLKKNASHSSFFWVNAFLFGGEFNVKSFVVICIIGNWFRCWRQEEVFLFNEFSSWVWPLHSGIKKSQLPRKRWLFVRLKSLFALAK